MHLYMSENEYKPAQPLYKQESFIDSCRALVELIDAYDYKWLQSARCSTATYCVLHESANTLANFTTAHHARTYRAQ
jgi:hypothetical protein